LQRYFILRLDCDTTVRRIFYLLFILLGIYFILGLYCIQQQFIIYVFKFIHFNRIYLCVFRFKIPKFCDMTRTTCFYRAPSKSWNIIRSTSSTVIRTLWKWPLRACCMPKLKEHTQYLLCQVSNPTAWQACTKIWATQRSRPDTHPNSNRSKAWPVYS